MNFRRTLLVGLLGVTFSALVGCSGLMPGPGPVDPDAPEEFSETASGLRYRILRKSDGKKPKLSGHVRVHYIGKLDDGTVFDNSYAKGNPVIFRLNDVVKGYGEGLTLIGEGGMIELEIPPELGYGKDGRSPLIPPDSTLHFVVEVIRVF